MNERRTIGIALVLGATAWLAGCPGPPPAAERPLDGAGGGGGACSDVETQIFAERCGACHGADHPAKGLDLVSPGLAARVVGKPAQEGCAGILADPQHPEESALYTKLLEAPGCGARMPVGSAPLSEEEMSCVKEWIAAQ